MKLGVVRTDEWLEKEIDRPWELCRKAAPEHEDYYDFYRYLCQFGMYRRSRQAKNIFIQLKATNVWNKIEQLYTYYQKKWDGDNVDIFIFPMDHRNRRFISETKGKSGITFGDKMFLFLTEIDSEKNLESLFIHEYHHVNRMKRLAKKASDYTLLDSLIFEGMAEHAVKEYCGEAYIASWCKEYPERELQYVWDRYFKHHIHISRMDRKHDDLLFGQRGLPKMIGYAIGYKLINDYKKKHSYKTKDHFGTDSSIFINQ